MGFQSSEINLLFIEDDPSSVNLMMEMLSKDSHTSFKFEHKGTLKDSLKVLKDNDCNYDVILLDLMLPNSAGIDTYESIRDICQNVPIVIISGFEDIACQCVKRGAQDYILKPDLTPGLIARSLKYAIERKKIEAKLKTSQEKYKELVEVTRAAIYEVDLIEDKFLYVNDVLCELTGWTKEEFMELKPTDLLTPKSLDQFARRMQALNSGEFIEPSFEYEVIVKDGSTKWTLITVKFKENEDKVVTSANVVAIDITRQKLSEELSKQKEESIFNELENRIHEWKKEMIQTSLNQKDRIRVVGTNIQSITNGIGVIQ